MVSLSTDPSFHVDLLQLLASYLIGTDKEFSSLNGRTFGILLADELPRVFCGGTAAKDFLAAFSIGETLEIDLAVNPLFGRLEFAPRIIATGARRGGGTFEVSLGLKKDGDLLRDVNDLHYIWLESPPYIYHAVRMALLRILEFHSFVATIAAFPERVEGWRSSADAREPAARAIVMTAQRRGVPVNVTLWNYDLPHADPSRLMLPTHAAWFLEASATGNAVKAQQPVSVRRGGWDIDSDAFLRLVGLAAVKGVVAVSAAQIDASPLVSTLLRRGSRCHADASRDGHLTIDGLYQNILPHDWHRRTALYGDAPGTLVVRERSIRSITVRDFDELHAAVRTAQEQAPQRLLFRGQTSHFNVSRSDAEKIALYGHSSASELSLTTSASREDFAYDAFHGRFQLYLQGLLYESAPAQAFQPHDDELERMHLPFENEWIRSTYRSWQHWYGESIWDLLVMGLAQHYGIPTHGLDLTDDLDVAAWFALNRFIRYEREGAVRAWYEPLDDTSRAASPPVIYAIEVDGRVLRNLDRAMGELPLPRPERVLRQRAYLHYGGWGLQTNACAEDVRLAIFLGPEFSLREPATADHYFPAAADDPFCDRMLKLHAVSLMDDAYTAFGRLFEFEDPRDGELYAAVMAEQFDRALTLLRGGAGVHHRDAALGGGAAPGMPWNANRGLTALHWAAFHGHELLVTELLERGAAIEASDINGRRPLVIAAMRRHPAIVKLLLECGAAVDAMDYAGWQMIPTFAQSPEIVALLQKADYRR